MPARTVMLGTTPVTFTPHYLLGVGPRVFIDVPEPVMNLSAEDLRLLGNTVKLAACEAEALARRVHRRRKSI